MLEPVCDAASLLTSSSAYIPVIRVAGDPLETGLKHCVDGLSRTAMSKKVI